MAFNGPQTRIPGLVAGADLTAAQYHFVKLSAANTVVICAAVTDHPIGVLQNDPGDTEEATVCAIGVTKVSSDAALVAGAAIGTSADGQAVTYTVADTTKYIVGHVLTATANAAEIATVFVNCPAARVLA